MTDLHDLTDLELTARQFALRTELKEITDTINDRRRKAIKETLRLASLSREDAGAAIRQDEPDDLQF